MPDVTFQGPALEGYPEGIPEQLAEILFATNGVVAIGGGLHVRGLTHDPEWHSLALAHVGPESVATRYPNISRDAIPFAQDCVGDQFLLEKGRVLGLSSEIGEVHEFASSLSEFFAGVAADPFEYLSLQPLLAFRRDGGRFKPGQLIDVYPPFCSAESRAGVSMRAISASSRLEWLAGLSAQLSGVEDGGRVRVRVVE